MAQNATIYKVEVSVSDMDRHYYETHKLTVAKHPSETDERLMVRLLAFALNAHEHLEMTKRLSTADEPDIWQKSLSGELATSLGLDEISLGSGSRSDATATGAAVTLGKRLSKDFYLAYETSLSGAFGSLYIFYDLSRRLTLRAQAGEQSALDLIFTVRRD